MSVIAYKGEVWLEKAIQDNVWGMVIQLKLEQRPHEKNTANPFKRFTKMRKGKVGTRFDAVFTCEDGSTFYQDEVMLKNWGDGTTGWTLHLWVNPDDDGMHPWMNVDNKSAFAVAMVELDDDNEAIDQDKRERLEKTPKHRREMTLSNYAAQLCRTPEFWVWLQDEQGVQTAGDEYPLGNVEEISADWMRSYLGIDSRSQLDINRAVATLFHEDIRKPYAEWHHIHAQ